VIGRLALPLTLVLASCAVEIVHDLEEPEANQLLASLQQHGIPAEKSRSVQGSTASYSLRVPSGQASKAWRVMREQNLPRPKRLGLGEVFAKPSLVPTATQERALLHHALGEEIAKTLQSVEGVVEARVHLVLPVRDPLAPGDAPRPAPRASALVRATAPAPIAREEVQRLVAGAVDGLKPEDVTVVIVTGARPAPAAASAELARLGPFLVAEGSASALKLTLIAAFALVGLLALGVVIALARQRALARRLAAAEPSAPPPSDTFSRHVDSSLGLIGRSLSRRPPADEGSRAKQ
jgi:type III secretion protein J